MADKKIVVGVRVLPELHKKLEEEAKKRHMSMGSLSILFIEQGLKKNVK